MSHAAPTHTEQPLEEMDPATQSGDPTPTVAFAPAEPAPESDLADPAEQAPADRRQKQNFTAVDNRKNVIDRRAGLDRRFADIGSPTGLERRRGPGRRLNENRKCAEEGEMTDEQFEFLMAIDTYKKINHRAFPTWTEVLEVVKQLGYRKVAASTIKLPNSNGRPTKT